MERPPTEVVVVTGLSGAGRSTALRALEDLEFFCVDNLPTLLVRQAIESCEHGGMHRLALGIDVRVGNFLDGASQALREIAASGHRLHILFLDASNEILIRRFNSTRRPHPLSTAVTAGPGGPAGAVLEGIQLERERLAPLRALASRVLDTTRLSVHELRRQVVALFGPGEGKSARMRTRLLSFGFKYGVPVDADLIFDVRFIENPFFIPELKDHSGLDSPVADFVLDREEARGFIDRALALLEFAMPRYEAEGKSYLTVAMGCTGGRHRSVAIAEHVAAALRRSLGLAIDVTHRDIDQLERDAPVRLDPPPPEPAHRKLPRPEEA